MTDRPNFLFIITDQHRGDYLGCTGHPVLKTPHIDSIAARGRRFDRFYVANPVCMPNRATLVTGRMPSAHGVRGNGIPLSVRANTFIDLLRAQGWRTALLGKSHLQNMTEHAAVQKRPPPAPERAAQPEGLEEAWKDPYGDWDYGQEHPSRWQAEERLKLRLPFYGYEHVDLCTGHGDQVGGHYYQWLREQTPDADALRDPKNQLPHGYICPQGIRTAVPEELYPTHWVTERTLDWLDAMKGGEKPFFAMVAYPDPHHPFTPPGRYWNMYDPADMPVPASFAERNRPVPPTVEWLRERRADGSAVLTSQTPYAVDERELRESMALTCGMIGMIDDGVGRILARLEQNGMAENTVVVFTADHGDFMGDHGIMLKGPIHYQGTTRVPFIWADTPDRAKPGANATLSGTVDIAATILDRAGLEPYWGMQGRSLMAQTEGAEDGDAAVIIEDDSQRPELGFDHSPRLHTLVTRDWRLSVYDGVAWGELYNLADDPHEMDNRFDDPACAKARGELFERMARMRVALVDRSPLPMGRA
ncbi:MAG: sulfatase-like hydrolase/transferase [Alphaproteobacteria bacterium]|nr:sulfatase-like hydrolase/transferase [Alphaproteobacteria bacterium]